MTSQSHVARILLVDDNADDVELMLAAFAEARLANHIEVARSGTQALDRSSAGRRRRKEPAAHFRT